MIISGSSRGSFDSVEIQMWCRHAGYAQVGPPRATNLNLRGMHAALDIDPTPTEDRPFPLGQVCTIGFANAVALGYMATVLGIVSSNVIVGVDCADNNYRINQWVNIQVYGHCSRIVTTVGGGAGWKYIVPEMGTEDGANWGMTLAAAQTGQTLTGIFTFDGPPANGETINLSGVTTAAGSWNAAPALIATGNGVWTPAMRVIGWYYDDDVFATLPEAPKLDALYQALFRYRSGFLCAMGMAAR